MVDARIQFVTNLLNSALQALYSIDAALTHPPIIITPRPTQGKVQTCRLFDIHDEKPESKILGVVLSEADFHILQQNDHVFTVIPAGGTIIQAVPNISIHNLNIWIKQNSVTPVPDVPANDV